MYGLDPTIDLSFFVGREVTQVCFGEYQFQVHFDGEVGLNIESKAQYQNAAGETVHWRPQQASEGMTQMLGLSVAAVEGNPDGTLILIFRQGGRLTVFDPTKEFEAYTISRPGATIVV